MRTPWTAVLASTLALALSAGLAAAIKHSPAGVVISVSGKVTLYSQSAAPVPASAKAGEPQPKFPRLGQTVYAGDRLKTGDNGRAALVLTDGTQLKMNYDTDITLSDRNSKGHSSSRGIAAIKIFIGELWAKVTKKDSTLEFDTPAAVAAVKGTEPIIIVGADGSTCVELRSGKVRMSNGLPGGATLMPNEQICLAPNQKITASLVQPWNSGTGTFETTFNQASQATVTVNYVDEGGVAKTLVLNYAAGPGVTATPQALTGSAH
ncbi:MAG TPA: FecR family protein [bacterium]|jgi:hypothetical protein|nr:FecR family protein [bacterium]